jgi:hypothetical protein
MLLKAECSIAIQDMQENRAKISTHLHFVKVEQLNLKEQILTLWKVLRNSHRTLWIGIVQIRPYFQLRIAKQDTI